MSLTTNSQGGEWRIAETAKRCQGCQTPFLPGTDFFSELVIERADEVTAYTRHDWCQPCWTRRAKSTGEPIYWKARRRDGQDVENVVDVGSLHTLFLGLLEDERPEIEALRYVVGLLLLRKKVLKVVRGTHGARGDLVFKDPRDPATTMRLSTPDLSE
jgi:hypothetical protein